VEDAADGGADGEADAAGGLTLGAVAETCIGPVEGEGGVILGAQSMPEAEVEAIGATDVPLADACATGYGWPEDARGGPNIAPDIITGGG